MSNLEDQLRTALRRREPSPDFAQRVLERTRSPREFAAVQLETQRRSSSRLRWMVAMAAALALAVGGVIYEVQVRRTRAQAELAGRQAEVALRIASAKLNVALRQIQRLDAGSLQNGTAKSASAGEEL